MWESTCAVSGCVPGWSCDHSGKSLKQRLRGIGLWTASITVNALAAAAAGQRDSGPKGRLAVFQLSPQRLPRVGVHVALEPSLTFAPQRRCRDVSRHGTHKCVRHKTKHALPLVAPLDRSPWSRPVKSGPETTRSSRGRGRPDLPGYTLSRSCRQSARRGRVCFLPAASLGRLHTPLAWRPQFRRRPLPR